MNLTDSVISLNGKEITGKDGRKYVIRIPGRETIGTVYVFDTEDHSRNGFIPGLRDLGDTLFHSELADFTRVYNQGLYKSLVRMISEAVPAGTKYRAGVFNTSDQDAFLKHFRMKDCKDLKGIIGKTRFGHVLQSSEFSEVRVFYSDPDGKTSEGEEALKRFGEDTEKGIYTSSHPTDLFLVGYKEPDPFKEIDVKVTAATDFLNRPGLYHLSKLNAERWINEAMSFIFGLQEKADASYRSPEERQEVMNYAYRKFEEFERASQLFI